MADQQAPRAINAPFPAPPPFWKHFTEENITRLEAIINDSSAKVEGQKSETVKQLKPSELRALEVPQELAYLIPPPPPTSDSYTVFSDAINISSELPTLTEQGVTQLFPSPHPSNPAPHLLLITKSILLNFLELTSALSVNPAQSEEKLDDLRTLFLNVHHLINLYRPHQARETLIGMLEERVEKGKEELKEMDRWESEVKDWLAQMSQEGSRIKNEQGLEQNRQPAQPNSPGNKVEKKIQDSDEAKIVWQKIHEIEQENSAEG